MLHAFTRVIDQAAAHVPALLWSPGAMGRMKSLVRRFPPVAGKTIGPARLGIIGLELRMAAGAEQVDLTFPVLREDRDTLLALADDEADGAWLRDAAEWSRVVRFCRRWADPGTIVGQHVELLWFEFDVNGDPGEGVPVPSVFVGFRPESTERLDPAGWRALLREVLDALAETPPDEATLDHFGRTVPALPPGAYVRFFGLMLSRGGDAVRFVVGGLTEPPLPALLEAIGWPGPAHAPGDALRGLATRDGVRVHAGADSLQYDVRRGAVLPRIGLECSLDRDAQAGDGIREEGFLRRLVEEGLCDAAKGGALLLLPGESVAPFGDVCMLGHARRLHHVKVVMDPGGPREAKAYYGRSLVVRPLARTESPAAPPVPAA